MSAGSGASLAGGVVGSLFSGCGGLDLGLERAGLDLAWMCESDPVCQRVLAARFPGVPCFSDVQTLVGEVRETEVPDVDVLAGGFP